MGKLTELTKYRLPLKPALDTEAARLHPTHRSGAAAGPDGGHGAQAAAPSEPPRPAHRRKPAMPVRSQILV